MQNLQSSLSRLVRLKAIIQALLLGDICVVLGGLVLVIYLFKNLWINEPATKVQISVGDKVFATYSLNQQREIIIKGPLGEATIIISQGRARFAKSPCHTQYCVHQGWLSHAGQSAICLPNQISLALLGKTKPYDTLNY